MTRRRNTSRGALYPHSAARSVQCRACRAEVLSGADGDAMAQVVRVDAPLGRADASGVMLRAVVAHLTGRAVVSVDTAGRLHDTDPAAMVLPGLTWQRVAIEHRCKEPMKIETGE